MRKKALKSFSKDDNYTVVPHSARNMVKDPGLLAMYWLLKQDASFGPRFVREELGGEEVALELQRDEILTTMRGLAAEAGLDHKTGQRKLKLLQELGYIESVKPINRYFSVIKLARLEKARDQGDQRTSAPRIGERKEESPDIPPPDPDCLECEYGEIDIDWEGDSVWWCDKASSHIYPSDIHPSDPEQPPFICPLKDEEWLREHEEMERVRKDIKDVCSKCEFSFKHEDHGWIMCEKLGGKGVKDRKRQCPELGCIELPDDDEELF